MARTTDQAMDYGHKAGGQRMPPVSAFQHLDPGESPEVARIREAYSRRNGRTGDRYSFLNPAYMLEIQEREFELFSLFSRHKVPPLETSQVLEIGCGTGYWIRAFLQWGARPENLFGIDLLPERIALARKLCPQGVNLDCANAATLAFPDSSFDLVLQSTVFTSILDESMKQRVAREMLRVLKPCGFVLWYDFMFDNPQNPDVRGVRRSEIENLFPGSRIYSRRVTLAPPVGRLVGRYSPFFYHLLSRTKVLSTHYLCLIEKN